MKKIIETLLGSLLTTSLLICAVGATAASDVLNISFTAVEEPAAVEEVAGDPVLLDISSLATAYANGGMASSDSDVIGSYTFAKAPDGTSALLLRSSPYDQTVDDYRVMFYVNKGLITEAHKYMRVTFMTNSKSPATASVISKPGQPKSYLTYDISENAGEWTRAYAVNISTGGTLERLMNGSAVVLQFSNKETDVETYVKEIAFFTSYAQAYTYYGDEVVYNANEYSVMTFTPDNGSAFLPYAGDRFYGGAEIDENGNVKITYEEKTNHNVHYMAKIKFNLKNAVPDTYRYMRVLYSAKNPEGTNAVSMFMRNDGGSDIVLMDSNITNTNGEFVLSDTVCMSMPIMQRLSGTQAKNVHQHCSLSFTTAKTGGEYIIKAVYFFPSREASEEFEMADTKTSVTINGNDISKYQIVIADDAAGIVVRSANIFADHIKSIIGVTLPVVTDKTAESAYEILVGSSDRSKSTEYLKAYDLAADNYHSFYTKLDGDTLIMNAANAYGVADAVDAILTGYFFKGVSVVPNTINVTGSCEISGASVNMKYKEMDRLYSNVEEPIVFTEDFDVDDGYFAEEDNTSDWSYVGGEYTTTAGAKRNLSYIHVYEPNVDYTAKLKYTAAGAEGDMALMLRYVGNYAYAKAGYDFEKGEWYIEYREGEDFYTFRIASVKATLTPGKQYTVNFRVDGRTAVLTVDGVELLRSGEMRHVTPGRIAVCAEDATVAVDDVKAVLLSGMGTVIGGIYHTNLEDGKVSSSTSFVELSDGSMYAYVPGYTGNYISKDGGQSWQADPIDRLKVSGCAHPIRLMNGDLLQVKTDSNNICAFTSKDDGKTWTKTGTVCPVTNSATGRSVSNQNDKIMQAPSNGRILYAATTTAPGDSDRLSEYYYSDDNGKTWSKFNFTNRDIAGLEDIDRFAESKMIECADGSLRVYTTWGGMFGCMHYFESTDGGKTWGPNVLMPEVYAPSSSYQIVRDPYGETDYTYYMVWVYAEAWAKPTIANRSRLALAKTTDGKNWEYLGDIWRWEAQYNHHNGPYDLNQIVNPSLGITKDALFIASGISERVRPDGNTTTHGDIQNHIWVIKRDFIPEGKPMNQFTDVRIGAKYYDAVTYVADRGLFTGTSETTFAPETTMSRSMFVTVLGRLEEIDASQYTNVSFSDVVKGSWYAPYVEWAASTGVVNGIGNGLFGVDDPITVETACVMLARYANNKTASAATGFTTSAFADGVSVSSWAADGVEWALANGIYSGQNGVINPTAPASRALVATMFYNCVNVFGE